MSSAATAKKPTRAALAAAEGKTLPDLIRPCLRVLFCGINPGLYSAATQLHFARPGNRFWPALHQAGFTEWLLQPEENTELLAVDCGLTSLVARATASAQELKPAELIAGSRIVQQKLEQYQPDWLAVLGIGAYRVAFSVPDAVPGPQPKTISGSRVWLLPSPSGANGSYPLTALVEQLRKLNTASSHRSSDAC